MIAIEKAHILGVIFAIPFALFAGYIACGINYMLTINASREWCRRFDAVSPLFILAAAVAGGWAGWEVAQWFAQP